MNAFAQIDSPPIDVTPDGSDYETVRRVIEMITLDYRDQPSLEAIASELGQSPTQLQKVFTRWAGLSPRPSSRPLPSTMPSACSARRNCRCSKPPTNSGFPVPAAFTTCSSPTRRCRPANGRRAAAD